MNIKRVIICIFLLFILYLFLQWLNKTSFKESLVLNSPFQNNLQNMNLQSMAVSESAKVQYGPYGQGQYGEPQMAINGYYVDAGIGGGYYYGGGQPINVKYIYNDIHHFFPFWYKQAAFA